jgi:predicted metal-binding membrane protein
MCAAIARPVHPVRRLAWHRPEWPWVALVLGAWVILALGELWPGSGLPMVSLAMPRTMDHGASAMSMPMPMPATGASGHHDHFSAATLSWWMLMTVAMMVPAIVPLLREISFHSLWRRRYRSAALFLATYIAVWGAFGAVAILGWSLAAAAWPAVTSLGFGVTLLAATAWSLTLRKRRYLKLCHRRLPLAPHGREAGFSCLRFGIYHARQCIGVCWPVMLAMIPGHTLLSMFALGVLVSYERLARIPRSRVSAIALASIAVTTMLLGA